MSPYAAGCASCGADLDLLRRAPPPLPGRAARARAAVTGIEEGGRWVGGVLLATLALPLLGVVLALVALGKPAVEVDGRKRLAVQVLLAVGIVATVLPPTRLGGWALL